MRFFIVILKFTHMSSDMLCKVPCTRNNTRILRLAVLFHIKTGQLFIPIIKN